MAKARSCSNGKEKLFDIFNKYRGEYFGKHGKNPYAYQSFSAGYAMARKEAEKTEAEISERVLLAMKKELESVVKLREKSFQKDIFIRDVKDFLGMLPKSKLNDHIIFNITALSRRSKELLENQ